MIGYTRFKFLGFDPNLMILILPFQNIEKDITNSNDFGAHWQTSRRDSRNRSNRGFHALLYHPHLTFLIALYILDFDLSIFKN